MNSSEACTAALNPQPLDYGDRVVLPDGRLGTVSRAGRRTVYVDADSGDDWSGKLADLRPANDAEIGQPRIIQLSLLED
jgi:hypothetical protein